MAIDPTNLKLKLSQNFSLGEFAVSAAYPDLASKIVFTEGDVVKLLYLCKTILQPLRNFLGEAIVVLSGKRSLELNTAVKGAPTSDHLFMGFSCACDFLPVKGSDLSKVQPWLTQYPNSFGQLITYKDNGGNLHWCHVSLPTDRHIGEFMTTVIGE